MHETEGWDNQQVLQELANKIEEYGHAVQEEQIPFPQDIHQGGHIHRVTKGMHRDDRRNARACVAIAYAAG